jgi:hypothetical protein
MKKNAFAHIWTKLSEMLESGELISSSEVLDELKDDDLLEWVKSHREAFVQLNPTIQSTVTSILKDYPTMIQIKSTGNSNADPFLVATAKVSGGCIVTDERLGDVKSKNYRIPNVCKELGIKYINLREFLDLILD